MTTHPDIERLLDHWLADGPTEVADRVIDQVADRIGRQSQQPAWRVSWRDSHVNTYVKPLLAIAAVLGIAVVGFAFLGQQSLNTVGGPAASPSPSPGPTPSPTAARFPVAGTGLGATPLLQVTAHLPGGWERLGFGATREDPLTGSGANFFASVIGNTFTDPCPPQIQRSPTIGTTVADWATALGEIPNTTATEPVQTTIAGRAATYLELTIPDTVPCDLDQFYLWQTSRDIVWSATEPDEVLRIWLFDVSGQSVAIAARTASDTGPDVIAELQRIVDSIEFDGAA